MNNKISLCIATFNEAETIHYPLDSAYDMVDEVVIVDGGSTDGTVEKARSYGKKVRVYHHDNPSMFHVNKQRALDKATGEWIIQLDADEALTVDLKKEIEAIVNLSIRTRTTTDTSKNEVVAYNIPRKNFFLTGYLMKGGVYPDYTIRFYKRGKAHFPCKSVHENVSVDGETGFLRSPLLHHADPDFSRYLRRWDRYTTIDAQELVKNKADVNFASHFVFKPLSTFFRMYVRHKGFQDGFPGFVFALFSSIRFWTIYIKWYTLNYSKKK